MGKCEICGAEYEPGWVRLFGALERRHGYMWHWILEWLQGEERDGNDG
jgi:hypothetical protein